MSKAAEMITNARLDDPFSFEKSVKGIVCGLDEVGRAPLAGPVTAACAFIPNEVYDHDVIACVTDSKKITKAKRTKMAQELRDITVFGVGWVSAREIEEINIHHASLLAMSRAYDEMLTKLDAYPVKAYVDGKFTPKLPCLSQNVIKGDLHCKSIGAASIIAKVERDTYMAELSTEYPDYGWESNSGYPTRQHLDALRDIGPCVHHRRTFSGVPQIKTTSKKDVKKQMDLV